ncbi:MAG: uracil-DNA glycosylase [Vampirovibrionales bacterium]|jgi:DNA polymerase|nr:uracil-DNA glycosylase [Vampirovibrionales bacterium]
MFQSLEDDKTTCETCHACELGQTRIRSVFSGGSPYAKIMVIGEAPGKEEDEQGEPFVGRSGQLLMKLFAEVGFEREKDLYICNTIKCRPPQNRKPTLAEKEACRPFLDAQIAFVQPKIIVLCGTTAVSSLLPHEKRTITQIRGQWFHHTSGAKIMAVFHPSYLLRHHSLEAGKPRALMMVDLAEISRCLRLNSV